MGDAFRMERPLGRGQPDSSLVAALALMAGVGLAALYSASYGYAMALGRSPAYFVLRQALWLLPSALAFFACAYLPLDFWRAKAGALMLVGLALLALPFMPGVGITKNGASRWFGFSGLSFQPSEFMKPLLVLYLAHILTKKGERLRDFTGGLLPPLVVIGAGTALVLLQNDFSSAVLVAAVSVVMLWVAGAPIAFFAAAASVGLPLAALSVLTSDYRLKRVIGFLAPRFDPADLSYQVNGSLRAIQAGGLWGRGLGQGNLKLRSIPLVQSDFVLAAWAEETGFLGVLALLGLWAFILFRGFAAALRAEDEFARRLGFGMGFYLGLQTLVNVLVSVGALPATGIPLPFFSSGGSSLLSASVAAGFMAAVSRLPGSSGRPKEAADV